MREIGSEFWDVPTANRENALFPKSTQWFLSGRSALQAIIKDIKNKMKIRTVAMPSWYCDSMIKPFIDAGIEVHFYSVYFDEGLIQTVSLDCDALFLMDYFGYTGEQQDLSGYSGVVIRDVTHSIFSNTYTDADYYFGSLRKWCGVWTGGYAWARDGQPLGVDMNIDSHDYTEFRKKAMELKSEYINGQESIDRAVDKSYLGVFNEAEDMLETIGIAPAAGRDVNAALRLDVEHIKMQHRKNAKILRSAFPDWLIFREMKEEDCPMFVPVFVPDGKRNELRRHLINNEIYCPVHWPVSEYHKLDDRTENIYANELSLVCDQRYTEEDMNRMVDVIREFWKEG